MFDDSLDDKRADLAWDGPGPLVTRARRLIALSYALEDRLRATGHLAPGGPLAPPVGRPLAPNTSRARQLRAPAAA